MATIGRVRTVWSGVAGAPYYTNHYWSGITDAASAQIAINAWNVFIEGQKTEISAGCVATIDGQVALLDDATGTLTGSIAAAGVAVTCTGAGEALPRASQTVIQWMSGIVVAGRRLRGRTYLPAPTETANTTGGVLLAAYRTATNTRATTFANTGSPPHLVVWSRTHGVSSPVLGATVWSQWGVLRSRRD